MNDYETLFTWTKQPTEIFKFHEENKDLMKKMPASVSNHHSYEGGYYDHILEVMNNVWDLLDIETSRDGYTDYFIGDIMTAAYIHDLDKLFYRYELSTKKPTQSQIDFAQKVGIELTGTETKEIISVLLTAYQEKTDPPPTHRMPRHQYREGALDMEDSGIVAMLCCQHGLGDVLNDEIMHAIAFHHGGWATVSKSNSKSQMSPMAKILHCADLLSTIQNGNVIK